jgi:hypothetical protein
MTRTTTFAGRPQLETLAEAQMRNQKRVDALAELSPEIAAALEACDPDAVCWLVICAVCSRRYRRRLIRELLGIAKSYPGQHEFATIYLDSFPAGKLVEADIKRAHERLRKGLQRTGFAGSLLMGATEVSWSGADRSWILHVHLLAIRVPPDTWVRLGRALRGAGPKFPLKVQPLRNPERQVSYMIKFHTFFRPRSRNGEVRSPAVPLPPDRLAELANWWFGYTFEDFTFLFGARRRGGQIVPEV